MSRVSDFLRVFILFVAFTKATQACQIQTENCTYNSKNFYFNMDCLEDQLSFVNYLELFRSIFSCMDFCRGPTNVLVAFSAK